MARLEKVGYIERRKSIVKCKVRTVVRITEKGYEAYVKEVKKLKSLFKKAL